jgi:membrane protease YdiL (CAAX protease family)
MRGILKSKSPGTQIFLVVSITLASFFLVGMIGTMILAITSDMSILEMGDAGKWDYSKDETIFMIRGMQLVQFVSLFLIPAWLCSLLLSTNSREYLGLRKPRYDFLVAGIVAMIISIPFVNWMGELNRLIPFPPDLEAWMNAREEEASAAIRALLSRRTVADLFLNFLFIAVLAAVGEELLFRGLLQRLFIKLFRSPWLGIILSAFLFSAMHLQFFGFIPRFILGVVLGLLYWYGNSLWLPIAAHFFYDAALILLSYFYPEMLNDDTSVEISNLYILGSLSLLSLVLFVVWMRKRSGTSYAAVYADDSIPVKDHPF